MNKQTIRAEAREAARELFVATNTMLVNVAPCGCEYRLLNDSRDMTVIVCNEHRRD